MNTAMTTTQPSSGAPITMSSLELVEFINASRKPGEATLRHDSLLAKAPQVLGEGDAQKFLGNYRDCLNRARPCYYFPKREACLMAMSYSYDLQAKVFDRMTELEAKQQAPTPLPAMTQAQMLVAIATQAAEQEQRMLTLSAKVETVEQRLDELAEVPKLPLYEAMPAGYVNRSRIRAAAQQRHGLSGTVVDFLLDEWKCRPTPKAQVRNSHPNAGESTSVAWLEREVNAAIQHFVGGCIRTSTQQVTHPDYGRSRFKLATSQLNPLPMAA